MPGRPAEDSGSIRGVANESFMYRISQSAHMKTAAAMNIHFVFL
jgi:hypothetical protein